MMTDKEGRKEGGKIKEKRGGKKNRRMKDGNEKETEERR